MHPVVLFLCGIWTITLYVLPTAIAFSRKKRHRWLIAVINILGGWIYGVPWLRICHEISVSLFLQN